MQPCGYRLFTWHAALQTTVQMKSSQNDAFDFEPPFVHAAFAQLTNGFEPLLNNNNNNNFCKNCSCLSGKKVHEHISFLFIDRFPEARGHDVNQYCTGS